MFEISRSRSIKWLRSCKKIEIIELIFDLSDQKSWSFPINFPVRLQCALSWRSVSTLSTDMVPTLIMHSLSVFLQIPLNNCCIRTLLAFVFLLSHFVGTFHVLLQGTLLCGGISTLFAGMALDVVMHPHDVFLQVIFSSCCVRTLFALELLVLFVDGYPVSF